MKNDDEIRHNLGNSAKKISSGGDRKSFSNLYNHIGNSRASSKEKEKVAVGITEIVSVHSKVKRVSKKNNTSLLGLNQNGNKSNNLANLNLFLPKNNSLVSQNTNEKQTNFNSNVNSYNSNFHSFNLKYPVPKLNKGSLKNELSHYKNLKLSTSMKNMSECLQEKKTRAFSYSPKNSNSQLTNFHSNSHSNYSKEKSKIMQTEISKSKNSKFSQNQQNTSINSISTLNNLNTIQSSPTSKVLKSLDFNKLPKLSETNTPSNREKNFNYDTHHTSDFSGNKNNYLFNIFYSELVDYKSSNNHNLIDCLVQIFENISQNCDSRFRKLVELTKSMSVNMTINETKFIELDKLKSELSQKEIQIRNLIRENEKLSKDKENVENVFQLLRNKYQLAKQNLKTLTEENKNFKNLSRDYKLEIDFLRDKELKMMKVMYILQKRGISIDEIINDHSIMNDSLNKSNMNDTVNESTLTVYFPDKINMDKNCGNKNTETKTNLSLKYGVNIPMLDFKSIPVYESDNDKEDKKSKNGSDQVQIETIHNSHNSDNEIQVKQKNKHIKPPNNEKIVKKPSAPSQIHNNNHNFKTAYNSNSANLTPKKIKDYQSEFTDKLEEYSESWRDEIKLMKQNKQNKNSTFCLNLKKNVKNK